MHKNNKLKKFTKNLKSTFELEFDKESKQREFVSNKCKANNTLTVFENASTMTRETKALMTWANFLTLPKNKLCPQLTQGSA